MYEHILKIRTPITYTRANEVLERVNELIGGFLSWITCAGKDISE